MIQNHFVDGTAAVDHVDDALGETRFESDPVHHFRSYRILATGADDDGASGGQRVGHERRPSMHGDVAGGDDQKGAQGLPEEVLVDAAGQIQDPCVFLDQAVRRRAGRFDVFQDAGERALGLIDGAAMVLDQDPAEHVRFLTELVVHREEHVGALAHGHVLPALERGMRSVNGRQGLFRRGLGQFGDGLARGRVGVRLDAGGLGIDPLPADEKFQFTVVLLNFGQQHAEPPWFVWDPTDLHGNRFSFQPGRPSPVECARA